MERIIQYLTNGAGKGLTYNRLAEFVDKFGNRFTGTPELEDSLGELVDVFVVLCIVYHILQIPQCKFLSRLFNIHAFISIIQYLTTYLTLQIQRPKLGMSEIVDSIL